MTSIRPPPIFEIADPALAQTTPSVLGMWTITAPPAPPTGAVAFGSPEGRRADVPLWRANLPPDLGAAQAQLRQGDQQVDVTQDALSAATLRLAALEPGALAPRQGGPVSFDLGAAPELEVEVAGVLRQIQGAGPPVSFDLGAALGEGWEQARQQFDTLLDRLTRSVGYFAWVETRVARQLQGLTTVDWTGQMNTVWRTQLAAEQARLHQQTLGLALRSRALMIRTIGMALQAAILITTPGGQILALPVIWKFINQWLAEIGQRQQS